VLALSLLPAGGNLAGGLLAESARLPSWVIGAALHAAAGIAIGVVSIDLMPRALGAVPTWLLIVAFVIGAAFSVVLARGVRWWRMTMNMRASGGAWMVYMAVATDLLSDGLMIGAASAVAGGLGFLLAISQVVGNLPGGFAAMANFRDEGVTRRSRLLIAGSFVAPAILGAVAGYWLLRGTGDEVQSAGLVFIAGVLLLTTVEDMVPQADEPEPERWLSTVSFTLGFVFLVFLSAYLD
jgi:zinc transporter, ZIP family